MNLLTLDTATCIIFIGLSTIIVAINSQQILNYFKHKIIVTRYSILAVFIFPLFSACNNDSSAELNSGESSMNISAVRLSSLTGESLEWKEYEGKTVFINFWATWCKPCVEEMPSIRNLMNKMKDENIRFLFASDETPEQISRFRERSGFDFPFVRVENLEELNIMALPTTFIFTASGKLAYSEMGFRQWDDNKNITIIQNIISSE